MGTSSTKNEKKKNKNKGESNHINSMDIKNKNYEMIKKINEDFSEEKYLKQFLFLTAQLEDLNSNANLNMNFEREFYLINDTLEKYKTILNIDEINKYIKDYQKPNLRIEELKSKFSKIISEIKKFYKIMREFNPKNLTNNNISQLDFNNLNDIIYPNNFFLIEHRWFTDFIEIFDEKKENFETNLRKGIIFENYIIIENIKDTQNFACSIKDKHFIIDFIFINEKSSKNDEFLSSIKEFLKNNKNEINNFSKNKKINLNNKKKEIIGFVICYPENNQKQIMEKKFEKEIYYRIKKYFSLDNKYKDFVLSLNKIKSNTINLDSVEEIEKLISEEKDAMNEFIVYAVNENDFKKIKEIIYLSVYEKHCESDLKEKKYLIKTLLQDEKIQKENIKDLQLKRLLFEDFNTKNNNKICLINNEFYNTFINNFEIEPNEYEINLLKINNEYYLYFNQNKKIIKIYGDNKTKNINESNIWSIKLDSKKEEKKKKK